MHKTKIIINRSRKERRVKDAEPPQGNERRITPERRHIYVEFVDFDEHVEIGTTGKSKAHTD